MSVVAVESTAADLKAAAPTISDYAVIGDCRTAALVSLDGSIDWLCLPNFSGASIFARLLDPDAGSCSLRPCEPFTASRRYVGDTAVLETTFTTETGCVQIIDCLPMLDGIARMRPMREILRIVEGVRGSVRLEARIDPRPDYARLRPVPKRRGQLGWCYCWGGEMLLVASDLDLSPRASVLTAEFTIGDGERRTISLCYTQNEIAVVPLLGEDADSRVQDTLAWWRDWSSQIEYEGTHRDAVVRSAVTLKLMTFALSGAVVAAPTTSLPEQLGGDRNWDYRYCWLRDAGLTMEAMIGLGILDDARAFLKWMLHATRLSWPKLQIMYDIYGRTDLEEFELPHLAGHRQSAPVRIGNGAHDQVQLDVYGEVIHAAYVFASAGGKIETGEARLLAGLGKTVCESWREPDSGIWEHRGAPRHYTFSKVMCWVALDRLIDLHERGLLKIEAELETYQRERSAIADLIERRGFNSELKAYTKVFDGNLLDASVLLMPSVGYRRADDERIVSTYMLIRERLGRNGLMMRSELERGDQRPPEGGFGICGFWAIEQVARRGETAEAERQFRHLLSFGNDVGLFAEEIDTETGDALGNFPQAFTHIGLINAALAIDRATKAAIVGPLLHDRELTL